MKILLAPYKLGSAGAKALAQGIGAVRTRANKRIKSSSILCNWGRSDLVVQGRPLRILNPSSAVVRATNKLSCLKSLVEAGVASVPYTVSREQAATWLAEGHTVYGRQLLNASQGKGIILLHPGSSVPMLPLYTRGILKAHEYRVHVFQGRVIDVTKKKRRNSIDRSDYIKNLSNGWVFCRNDIDIPDNLLTTAIQATANLGLDFGAVDLLYRKGEPYVLEINTAPGLQGTTLRKYIEAFRTLR